MQEDSVLVHQTLAGEDEAFCLLFRKYYGSIYAQILSIVKNPQDAEELANDVFVEAYRNLPNLRDAESFYAWLCQIAKHNSQDWLRQQKQTHVHLDDVSEEKELGLQRSSVEYELIWEEQLREVWNAIRSLPKIERSLIQDFYIDKMPYKALEQRYGLSKSAIAMRLFRARQRIRERVEELFTGIITFGWRPLAKALSWRIAVGTASKAITLGIATLLATVSFLTISNFNVQDMLHRSLQREELPVISSSKEIQRIYPSMDSRRIYGIRVDRHVSTLYMHEVEGPPVIGVQDNSDSEGEEQSIQPEGYWEFDIAFDQGTPLDMLGIPRFIDDSSALVFHQTKISSEGKELSIHEGKGLDISHGRGTVSTSTSGFIDSHQNAPEQAASPQPKEDSSKGEIGLDEKKEETILDEKMFLDEKGNPTDWEKWRLARMHKRGWFKPEDVPIIFKDPGGVTEGVYIWIEDNGRLGQAPIEPPEHIKARNKEIEEELKRITDLGDKADKEDAKKFFRLTQELGELNRPYQGGGVVLHMHTCNIPEAWMPYFDAIMKAEEEKFRQEMATQSRQAQ